MEPVDLLTDLLRHAADAHHEYETSLGEPDADWPRWYAVHMVAALAADGYQISKAG